MKAQGKAHRSNKISWFSIGVRLLVIITLIVGASFGAVSFLMNKFIKPDFEKIGEANNFEVNWHSAKEIEYTFSHIRSNSGVIIQTMRAAGARGDLGRQALAFFFRQNQDIAALLCTVSGRQYPVLINPWFFRSGEIDGGSARDWFENHGGTMVRAAGGETILLNAAPHFATPLLSMFFPLPEGSAGILFSPPESLSQSYLIDSEGSVFMNADLKLIEAEGDMANRNFISTIRNSGEQNWQEIYPEKGTNYLVAHYRLDDYASIVMTSTKHETILEQWKATTGLIIPSAAGASFILALIIWLFSRTISIPIETLAVAARKIEGGNFGIKLKPRWRDEIGALTVSFNKMSDALDKFGKFTNKEIAFQAMRGEIKPGGLPKHATIFFSDIRGFTEKSENFTKEFGSGASDRIVHWLNEYLTQMVECVQKTNGVVDKFIGDAVMAHWGTAYTSGSPALDAYNCICSALMMRKSLYSMNRNRNKNNPGDPPISIGCGINTGWVTAGQIGSERRMEYTVIGDPVNLAARVESLTKELGVDILITENTRNMVKSRFITEEIKKPITVKGKEKPVRLFAVINLAASSKGPRTLTELRKLLGLPTPDLSKVDVNAEEKKYTIGGAE